MENENTLNNINQNEVTNPSNNTVSTEPVSTVSESKVEKVLPKNKEVKINATTLTQSLKELTHLKNIERELEGIKELQDKANVLKEKILSNETPGAVFWFETIRDLIKANNQEAGKLWIRKEAKINKDSEMSFSDMADFIDGVFSSFTDDLERTKEESSSNNKFNDQVETILKNLKTKLGTDVRAWTILNTISATKLKSLDSNKKK